MSPLVHRSWFARCLQSPLPARKSTRKTSPLGVTLILPGLISRWTTTGSKRMQVLQGITGCDTDSSHFIFRQRTHAVCAFAQIFAFDIIHHQVLALVLNDEMVSNTRQVGVAQIRQDDGFAPELACVFLVVKQVFFDGYGYTQAFIGSAIDCAHAPFAQGFNNTIAVIKKFARFHRKA